LAPVYGWFTEGFDTLDLREAKALLDELKVYRCGVAPILLVLREMTHDNRYPHGNCISRNDR
jgi:hypothetical protein